MTLKIVDLSQLIWHGSAMWPRLVSDIQIRGRSFGGIRSTGWQGQNHPGWFDFGQPYPYNEHAPGQLAGGWVGHLHAGTHVEAPKYCIPEGITADKIPLENLYGTGVVLDMRDKGKWGEIEAKDFEKAKPEIKRGDFVVVNTGWHEKIKPGKSYDYYHYYPALLPSAAEWLVRKKVKAIAGTWPAIDHSLHFGVLEPLGKNMPNLFQDYKKATGKAIPKKFDYLYEGCLVTLLKAGISVINGAGGDIDSITGKRCTLCAWPFRLEDTDAAMVRLVAIFE